MTLTKCCQFYMFSDGIFNRKETKFIVYVLISRFLIKIVSSEFKTNNNIKSIEILDDQHVQNSHGTKVTQRAKTFL